MMGAGQRIKCKKCGSIIQSMSRHDFKQCSCGKIFIDGGSDYCRIGFPGGQEMTDWIQFIDKPLSTGESVK
jgi:hypothetical protein